MRKILKYGIFIFILFLSFNVDVLGVTTKTKDFCNEDQEYMDPCDYMAMQCTYSDKNGSFAYINVNKSGNAKGMEGNSGENDIKNWGQKDKMSIDAKQYYQNNNQCPKYLLVNWSDYYLTDDSNYNKDYKAAGSPGEVYELRAVTTNSYDPIEESEKEEEKESDYPDVDNCAGFTSEASCKVGITANSGNFGCVWNEDYKKLNKNKKGFCSPNGLIYLSCGSGDTIAYDIPVMAPRLTSYAITALKTVTPVILIIMGMFQLIKAITSQNDDEMKKAKSSLIKKVIASVIIFFMVSIVQFVVEKVADDAEQESLSACLSCFLNNDCGKNYYYTDGYGNCYNVSDNKKRDNCPVEHY